MALRFLQAAGIKKKLKSDGLRTSGKLLEILDHEIGVRLEELARMAQMDKSRTVLPVHIGMKEEIAKLSNGLRRRTL